MLTPILTTKLYIPPPRPNLVPRPRLMGRLAGVSPLGTLERGYAIVRHRETGTVVHSMAQVVPGDALDARVADGEFEAKAE